MFYLFIILEVTMLGPQMFFSVNKCKKVFIICIHFEQVSPFAPMPKDPSGTMCLLCPGMCWPRLWESYRFVEDYR